MKNNDKEGAVVRKLLVAAYELIKSSSPLPLFGVQHHGAPATPIRVGHKAHCCSTIIVSNTMFGVLSRINYTRGLIARKYKGEPVCLDIEK